VSELTVQVAALAWANGRIVEVMGPASLEWAPVIKVGGGDGEWGAGVFAVSDGRYRFRLAPVPPAKKWRPWTAEDVPFGALLRTKGGHFIHMIVAFNTAPKEVYAGQSWAGGAAYCLEHAEHSIDGGKTWLPCGVEVTE
jgi:hypothetical protein